MTRADLAVLFGLLLGLTGLYKLLWLSPVPAQHVQIAHAGQVVGSYALNHDRIVEVAGDLGPSRVEIRDGRARFLASPCRQKICVRSGWLQRQGAAAACVPNRIALLLGGQSEFDGVAW